MLRRLAHCLPSSVIETARDIRFRLGWLKPGFELAPRGWNTVLDGPNPGGWHADSVVEIEKSKWKIFCQNCQGGRPLGFSHEYTDPFETGDISFHNMHITYAYALALAVDRRDSVSILDWGAALGHYYQIAKAVLPNVRLEFHCKEVPSLARLGKELNPSLRWYTDDQCLSRQYDFVMLNGSLPYLEDWKGDLRKISGAAAGYFYLTRQGVLQKSASFVAIQRVYGTEMLHWHFNKKELVDEVLSHGFRLVREFVVGDKIRVYGASEQSILSGFLFKREL